MRKNLAIAFVPLLAAAALAACTPMTPRLDAQFGDAVGMARARQVIDKDAPQKNAGRDAAGMDGRAAKAAIDRYQKSFAAPEAQTNVFTIGVTGAGSSSAR